MGCLNPAGAQSLGVDQSSLSFTAQLGGPAVSKTLTVIGSTSGLAFTASTNASWLKVNPVSGTTGGSSAALTVTADPTNLGIGSVQALLTIQGANTIMLPVTLNITGGSGQSGSVSPASLTFFGQVGGTVTAAQTVTVSGSANGQAFNVQSNAQWLKVTPASGSTPS